MGNKLGDKVGNKVRNKSTSNINRNIHLNETQLQILNYIRDNNTITKVTGAKNKLANQMDNLSVSDKHYEWKYQKRLELEARKNAENADTSVKEFSEENK